MSSNAKNGSSSASAEAPVEEGEKYLEKTEDQRPCFFKYCVVYTKIWAVLTLAAMWYLSVTLVQRHQKAQVSLQFTHYYTLGITIFVTIFEFLWLISKCTCCKDDGNCCCTLWRVLMWVNNWKKGLLYVLIAIPTFVEGTVALLGVICGVLLILLGVLYMMKSVGESDCVKKKKYTTTRYVEVTSPKAKLVEHAVQMEGSDSEMKPVDKNYKSTADEGNNPFDGESAAEPPKSEQAYQLDETKPAAKSNNPFDEEGPEE